MRALAWWIVIVIIRVSPAQATVDAMSLALLNGGEQRLFSTEVPGMQGGAPGPGRVRGVVQGSCGPGRGIHRAHPCLTLTLMKHKRPALQPLRFSLKLCIHQGDRPPGAHTGPPTQTGLAMDWHHVATPRATRGLKHPTPRITRGLRLTWSNLKASS